MSERDMATPAHDRRPVTIHQQFLFALIGVNVLVMLVSSVAFYAEQKKSLLAGIDAKLTSVATLAREMMPPDYHDRITGPESVSDSEFHKIVNRNNRLCVELGLEYIWSLMVVDGRIVFTTSTSPDKVADNHKHAHFFETHSNPELYTNTFATMRMTCKSCHDKWGAIRVVLIPSVDGYGRKYLFGASVRLTEVNRQLNVLIVQSLALGLVLFAVTVVVGVWVARVVTAPLHRLAETIQLIAAGKKDVEAVENGTYEQVTLARYFNQMNRALQGKIDDLQTASARLIGRHDAEIKRTEDSLQETRRMLEESQRMAKLGAWTYDVAAGKHLWSDEVYRIYGVGPDFDLNDVELGIRFFTPECRPIIRQAFLRAVEQGEPYDLELAFVRANGEHIWTRVSARPIMENGKVIRIDGNFMDITERKRVERALRDSEQRYRQLFEMESDALFLIDNETGRILDVNLAAQTLYGYNRDELRAMRNVDLSAEPEQTRQATQNARAEETALIRIAVRWHRKHDGTLFPVEIAASSFTMNGRSVHIAAIRDITERRRAEELLESWNASLERRVAERTDEVERYTRQLQALTGRLVRAEEDERQRISDVLHEDLQQILVAARMTLGVVSESVSGTAVQATLSRVDGMLTHSLQLTRTLVQEIAIPAVREGDLSFAVNCLTHHMYEKFGLTVTVISEHGVGPVSENVYLCLYRAVQELLFNVVKHAKVLQAEVRIAKTAQGMIQVTVSDQGCGSLPEALESSLKGHDGFGLFSIRERVEGLGGSIRTQSTLGSGTTVTLTVSPC